MEEKQVLNFYTNFFPRGGVAESFATNEVLELGKKYHTINIFPAKYVKSPADKAIPDNAKMIDLLAAPIRLQNNIPLILKNLFLIIQVLYKEMQQGIAVKHLKNLFISFSYALVLSERVKPYISKDHVNYVFWMNDYALALAILKHKKVALDFSLRTHGYDLYDERHILGKIPFRAFIYAQASNIINVAQANTNYLKIKYPKFSEKYCNSYLGVYDSYKPNSQKVLKKDKEFIIVSCSRILPLKRVHLIAEILANLKFEETIHWIHIGDGDAFESIKNDIGALFQSSSNTYELKGFMSNPQIMDFYNHTPVDAFIHLSETEGLPVVMMEAINFGIPIFSTDVGGVKEIVTDQVGKVIDVRTTNNVIEDELIRFLHGVRDKKYEPEQIRNFWKANFSIVDNTINLNKILRSKK